MEQKTIKPASENESNNQPLLEMPESESYDACSLESCRPNTIEDKPKPSNKFLTGTPLLIIVNASVIGLVAFAWCLSTQFSKSALNYDTKNFNAPYFMMWFNTDMMLACFPVFLVYEKIRTRKSIKLIYKECQRPFGKSGRLTVIALLQYVFPFIVFWVGANYPYVRALLLINASVATAISACNAAFVYILAVIFLKDSLNIMKMLSVLFAIGGVVVIACDGTLKVEWLGVLLAFLSAFMAAVYKVAFKRVFGNATLGEVSLFMTCLGFVNYTLNWIVPLILAFVGVELFHVSYIPWWPMIVAAILSMIFNFTINFGIALLNPLVISVGMLCGIPLNTAIDIIFRGSHASPLFLIGTALIIISFILIIIPYDKMSFFKFAKIKSCS